MLSQVAEGVLVHQSPVLQNNTVVVQGSAGVLLVDAGIGKSALLAAIGERAARAGLLVLDGRGVEHEL